VGYNSLAIFYYIKLKKVFQGKNKENLLFFQKLEYQDRFPLFFDYEFLA